MVARHSPHIEQDKPQGLKPVTTVLVGLLILIGILMIAKSSSSLMPVREISLHGSFQYANQQKLQYIIDRAADVGFLAIDLPQTQAVMEQLPWIKAVKIERVWPDNLRVYVTEKTAYLRLGTDKIVSVGGVVFSPASTQQFSNLPLLDINKAYTPELFRIYREMEYSLARNGYELKQFHINQHGEWALDLSQDIHIEIGRNKPFTVFKRFIAVFPNLGDERINHLKSIDLRYENGFAIGFSDQ
ncbi:MAG: FtsQ-type POTRA domain-containing protein [Methylococcales bacterium]